MRLLARARLLQQTFARADLFVGHRHLILHPGAGCGSPAGCRSFYYLYKSNIYNGFTSADRREHDVLDLPGYEFGCAVLAPSGAKAPASWEHDSAMARKL
jgi:hypothetical protein